MLAQNNKESKVYCYLSKLTDTTITFTYQVLAYSDTLIFTDDPTKCGYTDNKHCDACFIFYLYDNEKNDFVNINRLYGSVHPAYDLSDANIYITNRNRFTDTFTFNKSWEKGFHKLILKVYLNKYVKGKKEMLCLESEPIYFEN